MACRHLPCIDATGGVAAAVGAGARGQSTAYTPAGVLVLAGSLANCPPNGRLISKSTAKTIASVALLRWLLMPLATAGECRLVEVKQ